MNKSNRVHTLINKNGFEIKVTDVAKFSKLNNISETSIYNLVNGVTTQCKGYTLKGNPVRWKERYYLGLVESLELAYKENAKRELLKIALFC